MLLERADQLHGLSMPTLPTTADLGSPLKMYLPPPVWKNQVFFSKPSPQGSGKQRLARHLDQTFSALTRSQENGVLFSLQLRESRTEEFSAPNVILHLSIKLYINCESSII